MPETSEGRRQEILALLDTAQARQAQLDAALASDDPERRAWAQQAVAEQDALNAKPERQYLLSEVEALVASIMARDGHPEFVVRLLRRNAA